MWIFKLLNTNFIHNLLNLLMGVNAIILWAGCRVNEAGVASCEQAWIPPEIAMIILAIAAPLKIVINLVRDGFPGLFKQQPPVVSEITKTEVTVRPVAKK